MRYTIFDNIHKIIEVMKTLVGCFMIIRGAKGIILPSFGNYDKPLKGSLSGNYLDLYK